MFSKRIVDCMVLVVFVFCLTGCVTEVIGQEAYPGPVIQTERVISPGQVVDLPGVTMRVDSSRDPATVPRAQIMPYETFLSMVRHNVTNCGEGNPRKWIAHAYGNLPPSDLVAFTQVCVTGGYFDWGLWGRPHLTDAGYVHHATFWCDIYPSDADPADPNTYSYIKDMLENLPRDFAGIIFFFNEPDLPAPQCDRDPEFVADTYIWLRETFPNAKIVGPMYSHTDGYHGWAEFREFRAHVIAKTGLPPDLFAYSLHDYDQAPNVMLLESLLGLMEEWGDGDKNVYVTEYGSPYPHIVAEKTRLYGLHCRVEVFAYFSAFMDDDTHHEDYRLYGKRVWVDGQLTDVGHAFAQNGNSRLCNS